MQSRLAFCVRMMTITRAVQQAHWQHQLVRSRQSMVFGSMRTGMTLELFMSSGLWSYISAVNLMISV